MFKSFQTNIASPKTKRPGRATAGIVPDTVVMTARELRDSNRSFQRGLPADVEEVFGPLPKDLWKLLLWGPPGGMKTTSALKLCSGLAKASGAVLYNSLEQGAESHQLSQLLTRMGIDDQNLLIGSIHDLLGVIAVVKERDIKTVVIDSINMAGNIDARDYSRLSRECGINIVLIAQATKTGQYRGSQEFAHLVDVVVELPGEGRYKINKNRFAECKQGNLPWFMEVPNEN